MSTRLAATIDAFFAQYSATAAPMFTEFDPQWRSPCEVGEPWAGVHGERQIAWQPVKRHTVIDDFAGLERALEIEIHPDVKAHYGRYWSANLHARAPDGYVDLLYLWNPQDVDRLIENLIGHALACRYNKTPFSVFFACTEDSSDLFLTINNETGQIMLEEPGKAPLRVISASLADFMASLTPCQES